MTTRMGFDECYRAVSARDRRFDGQFVTAVRTTGIYCRPSCPARTPLPANVSFYPTSAAAHEAGYRACRRCLPEAAPGSPAWDIRGDAAARALRLIADGIVDREGVSGLAARLGYSSRHLGRLLADELGAGPLALARAHRAHTARALLVETDLPMGDVAFAAGFASVRQFNDTVRQVFALSPTRLRALRPGQRAAPGEISLSLPVREPFDAPGLFRWMASRAVAGVEEADDASFSRTLRLARGSAWFRVRADDGVRLTAHLQDLRDLGSLIGRVRRLFDLDADPVAVDAALSAHPELAPLVAAAPGARVPGAADPGEMLVRAMVGQQISVASARTLLGRLADRLGERLEIAGEERTLFPTPEAIAERGRDALRGPARRVDAIVGAAAALADGSLSLTGAEDAAEQRAALLALPGVGPWTADYVRMRVSGDPDVLLTGDLALRQGAARAGIPDSPRALAAWGERLAPWRSYAAIRLWANARAPKTGDA
ncbi:AlkA N-terminal domain-containing protein [Microbacterium sp. gxy059]|uniref:AlkA N-terminal domain-containing protein n=1 Tax=Microbacterium sp. gxy059 TaxID=2957199 RepID=UPI003D96BB8F